MGRVTSLRISLDPHPAHLSLRQSQIDIDDLLAAWRKIFRESGSGENRPVILGMARWEETYPLWRAVRCRIVRMWVDVKTTRLILALDVLDRSLTWLKWTCYYPVDEIGCLVHRGKVGMTWARSQIAIAKRRSAATTGVAFGEHRRQGERSVLVVL